MYRDETYAKPAARGQSQAGDARTYYVRHDFEGSAELTTTLAHAISDVTGVDVTDTRFTLNDHVDPEALDRLFEPQNDGTPRVDGHLSFPIWNHQVTVYSNGQIAIVPPRQPQTARGHRSPR